MSEVSCIYNMDLIDEKDLLTEDLLKGKAFDILLILLSGEKTIKDIAKELKAPYVSIKLHINRLENNNLIKVKESKVLDQKIEKTYVLVSSDIQIINQLKENHMKLNDNNNIELAAQQFASIVRENIRNIDKYKNKPNKIKALFIKSDDETMLSFKKDLDILFNKYESVENFESKDTYGLITVLAPYNIE